MKQVFEIINPSDAYTIVGEYKVATVAVAIVSTAYGIHDRKEELSAGPFFFGGFEEWCKENSIPDIKAFIEDNKEAIVEALESVMIGSFGERNMAEKTLAMLAPEKREEWLAMNHDSKRSSINNIGQIAWDIAKSLRKSMAKEDNNA